MSKATAKTEYLFEMYRLGVEQNETLGRIEPCAGYCFWSLLSSWSRYSARRLKRLALSSFQQKNGRRHEELAPSTPTDGAARRMALPVQRSETMNEVRRLDMKVHDVMTSIVKCCGPEIDLSTATSIMWEADCGALPVVDEAGRVIGMITDRDIAIAAASRGRPASDIVVSEVISWRVYGVSRDEDIKSALKTMRQEKVRRLPVVNDDGILQGILSLNDIILCAEDVRGRQVPDITYEDVVSTCKAICERRPQQVAVIA